MHPDLRGRVVVEASTAPSEDPEKVLRAIENVLADSTGEVERGKFLIKVTSDQVRQLNKIRDQLRDRHVRSAARRLLMLARKGDSTSLMLNRQAASAGILVICSSPEQSPLGPIFVTIESESLEAIIDWLTGYEVG